MDGDDHNDPWCVFCFCSSGSSSALTFVQGRYVTSQLTHSWKLSWLCVDFPAFQNDKAKSLTFVQTPMGALSVVISAILSHIVLKEKLSLFGWIGSVQCILGASILALNAPEEQSVTNIVEFKKLFLAPGFLAWGSVTIVTSVILVAWVAPKYGHRSMLPHIGVCSLIGGLSVSCIQGLGACILTTIRGDNQVGSPTEFTVVWALIVARSLRTGLSIF